MDNKQGLGHDYDYDKKTAKKGSGGTSRMR
jgi:hypothetical protein